MGNRTSGLGWVVGTAIFLGALISFVMPQNVAFASSAQEITIHFVHGSGVNPRHFERMACQLSTKTMTPVEAKQLRTLLDSTAIMNCADNDFSTTEGGPFNSLEISADADKKNFQWSYDKAPGKIQPLVRFLEERCEKTVYENGQQVK
ncbi:MAG: hypothetical protein IAF58_00090 [Leptolyngbya sp.]|nr:hypothetical protein [Candidatus Melainabacteria bacterium]